MPFVIRIIRSSFLFYLLFISQCFAQDPTHKPIFNSSIDNNINGYWEYLPRDYAVDTDSRYPLVIFLHGAGAQGSVQDTPTISKLLVYGPPKIIQSGNFPEDFSVGGRSYRFIVLSPQIKSGIIRDSSIISPATIKAFIDHARANYRIDIGKIYLIGLSMGGGGIWDFLGSDLIASTPVAAAAISAGAGKLNQEEALKLAQARIPVLAGHNIPDDIIEVQRTRNNIALTESNAPAIAPRAFYWDNPGAAGEKHNSWSRMFEDLSPGATTGGNLADSLGGNLYEWLLQFTREAQAPVPLRWEAFTVKEEQNIVTLTWIVSEQYNVLEFQIEHSENGKDWQTIASVPATNAANRVTYNYVDKNPRPGTNFYQVRQRDLDGKFSFSGVRMVRFDAAQTGFKIYPSPFTTQLSVAVPKGISGNLNLRLYDLSGRIVAGRSIVISNGPTLIQWANIPELPVGVYQFQLEQNGRSITSHRVIRN